MVMKFEPSKGVLPIPHVDVEDLRRFDSKALDRLIESLVLPGFFAVRGLDDQLPLVEANKRAVHEVMSLPEEIARKYVTADSQRGLVEIGKETAKGFTQPDPKRFGMVVNPRGPRDPKDRPFGPNIWVPEVPRYERLSLELLRAQHKDSMIVMRAIERGLRIDEGVLTSTITGGESIQRSLYTPGHFNADVGANISAPHEDINNITALWPEPGLEVYIADSKGEYSWWTAGVEPGAKVYNTGEMLAYFGCVRAIVDLVPTKHRVISDGSGRVRMTFPYFLHSRHSTVLRPGPFMRGGVVYPNLRYGPLFAIRMVELGAWDLKHRPTFDRLMECGLLDYMPEHQVYKGESA